MNPPEKIINLYLRLNGFFTMPYFTTLGEENSRHSDIIAVRLPGSAEIIGNGENITLSIDNDFFTLLEKNRDDRICLICEVKGGNRLTRDPDANENAINYIKNIFGDYRDEIQIVVFTKRSLEENSDQYYNYEITRCYSFIQSRFEEAQEISDRLGGLTKAGSWTWSEDFLSTLLYIYGLQDM